MHLSTYSAGKSILLVDEDELIIRALVRMLRPYFSEILIARSGEEALAILEKRSIDVLVADSPLMPSVSGLDLFQRARSMHPDLVTILLSGYADYAEVRRARNEGVFHASMSKPWDNNELMDALRMALKRSLGIPE